MASACLQKVGSLEQILAETGVDGELTFEEAVQIVKTLRMIDLKGSGVRLGVFLCSVQ